MRVIDQQGNQVTWTAVYARYHHRHEDECDSLKDAVGKLYWGSEYGELAALKVVSPTGQVLEGEELDEALRQYEQEYEQPGIEP